jgi:predicted RNase H-like HicB family nuclease
MSEKEKMEKRIKEISRDIESYKEAIENAEGAIVEAERELDEILEACYEDELAEQESFPDA